MQAVRTPQSNRSTPHSARSAGTAGTTPDTPMSARTTISTPGSNEFIRGTAVADDSYLQDSDEESEVSDEGDIVLLHQTRI
jgi:hypothetical protein